MPAITLTEEYIAQQLAAGEETSGGNTGDQAFLTGSPRPAAVLIPLFHSTPEEEINHTWHILLTRRTNSVAEHQGQVAFPGGRADPTDLSAEATALREAYEEIGLPPTQVKILGRMNEIPTISNYCVTPVVGVIPWPFPLQIESTEVSRVFSIPLEWLADPSNYEVQYRQVPLLSSGNLSEKKHPVIFFKPFQDELLWGVSAQITLTFVNLLYNRKISFTEQL